MTQNSIPSEALEKTTDDKTKSEIISKLWSEYSNDKERFINYARLWGQDYEDVVQDTFLAFVKRKNFVEIEDYPAYLCNSLRFTGRDHVVRSKNREKTLNEYKFTVLDHSNPEDLVQEEEDRIKKQKLFQCFERLSKREKEVLRDFIWNGLSHNEIAEKYNIKKKTSSLIKWKAQEKLKNMLGNPT